jgi:uncharacterized protein (TIGR02145 family)
LDIQNYRRILIMAVAYSQHGVIIRGGGGVPFSLDSIVNIIPIQRMVVVDKNGYIGYDITQYFQYSGNTYYYNYAILDNSANYSEAGLGQVTFYTTANNIIGGREYRTTIIGGKEWLAENLDYKFPGLAIGSWSSNPSAGYYGNDEAQYGIDGRKKCGLLYNWYAVKYLEDHKSEYIPGWHVPTDAEWTALINAVGANAGTKLKAINNSVDSDTWPTGWGGTDDYGFGVLPAGLCNVDRYADVGSYGNLWSVSENSSTYALYLSFSTSASVTMVNYLKIRGMSLRLVKDSE